MRLFEDDNPSFDIPPSNLPTRIPVGQLPSTSCMLNCPLRKVDERALIEARNSGDHKLAEEISLDIAQREARCLGAVLVGDEFDCGVEHGNTTDNLARF